MNKIIKYLGLHPCRRCINKHFGVKLQPSDCYYYQFPETCTSCGQVHHIVTGLKPSGWFKMLFAKTPKIQP